ncbi:hypothetical protein ABPG72_015493 [Tetrahymena utriculariae]
MSENKFQHDGIYALHILQNQEKQINIQNQHQKKSNVASSIVGQHHQSVSSQLNQNGINRVQQQNQKKDNSQNSRQITSQSYADFIAEKANEYRQHKNSRFEQKMQPQPSQLSQRSPKGSNLSVWATEKENRFEWIGKDQNKYFQEINGQLKSYNEIQVYQSTQGSWQNLIDKTPITEKYQKKRSLSRDVNAKQNTLRVLHPDQQETPRFNPCFKGVMMQEQINPLKLEERARENKIQKKHQNNLLSYEKIVNKGVIPDTTGREIATSRRKSTDIKIKYDYSTRIVLKTEEGIPIKYSPSKIRQMYEEAYNNNMNSVIFQTGISQGNESFVQPQKISQSKIIQSVSTLNNYDATNPIINPQINNFLEQKGIMNNQSLILKDFQRISKPPLMQSTIVEKNNNNNKVNNYQQCLQKNTSQNNKDTQVYNQVSNKIKSSNNTSQCSKYNTSSNHGRKNSLGQLFKQEYSTQDNRQASVQKNKMDLPNSSQNKSPEQINKNFYNVDYQFNQNRQRSNSKRRSSQSDVFRAGDRLWTDVRDQNQEELNKDPSRERLKTNTSDRYNFQGNQDFWQSQKQEQLWKQEMKLKEMQNNNIILDDRKKVNRRTQSLSTNLLTEGSTNLNDVIIAENQQQYNQLNQSQKIYNDMVKPQQGQISFQIQPQIDRRNSINNSNNNNSCRINKMERQACTNQNSLKNSPNRTRQNSQAKNNYEQNYTYQMYTQENSKSNNPRQYDYSPQQRVKTKPIEKQIKLNERDQTPREFYNIDFSQARAIKQKMQRSQIQF